MDNLTHTLTGLMLSRVIPRSVTRAGLLMMVAANAPDLDVLWSWPGGTAHYLNLHRGISHSLPFSPIMALLAVAIVWLVERRPKLPWAKLWFFSWIGVLSHLGLDWTNVYGVRLLLPFSAEWFRLDTVNIVDLVLWTLLLIGVAAPALGKLVSSEIGAKPGRGTGWAAFVLMLVALYEGGRYMAHQQAIEVLNSRIYEAGSPVRVAAFAQTANPFTWKGLVETSTSYIVFNLDLLREFDPASGRVLYKPQASPAIEAAKKTREFQSLIDFSSYSLWRVTPLSDPEGASRVELIDLRFGSSQSLGLTAAAVVESSGRVVNAAVGFGGFDRK